MFLKINDSYKIISFIFIILKRKKKTGLENIYLEFRSQSIIIFINILILFAYSVSREK